MAFATTDRTRRAVGDGPGARKPDRSGLAAVGDGIAAARRRMSIVFDRRGSRLVREVVEDDSSIASRLAWIAARLTIRPVLTVGSYLTNVPWPYDLIDLAAAAVTPVPGSVRATIRLPHCTVRLVRAAGVLPADGSRRVVLYMHGGAFLFCGANTHDRLVTALSRHADAPVLVVNYRMLPVHSLGAAIDDCYDGYRWLRGRGYGPEQIVLAGDSAGGYLSLALAERLLGDGEKPAAMVWMSPLLQLAKAPKQAHPNLGSDAMLSAKAFDALSELVANAARHHLINGLPEEIYEPLEHIVVGLPPTLIHVSGCEVLLHDARLAARRLAGAGVPVQLRVWPGQMHVFQIAAPMVPEADRSLHQIGDFIRDATDRNYATSRPRLVAA